jgi:hypothetical protein
MNGGLEMSASVDYVPASGVTRERSSEVKPRTGRGGCVDGRMLQPCPVCGRPLRVLVEYLGTRVRCSHCHGTFIARDSSSIASDVAGGVGCILQRANRWLAVLESS